MVSRVIVLVGVLALAGCGRATSPGEASVDRFMILAPASGSADLVRMFQPEGQDLWAEARSRARGFQFYQQNLRPSCAGCGGNTGPRLSDVGAFRYLTERGIQINIEAGAVKEHTCDGQRLGQVLISDVATVYASGAHVTAVAMDEPFTAGLPVREASSGLGHCDFTVDQVVVEVDRFVNTIRQTYPDIRFGLIEAYPSFTVDELMTFVTALLDNEQVPLSFFRLDYDVRHRFTSDADSRKDIKRLANFLASRGIEFEVIVTGYDGRTDAEAVASAMALAYEVSGVVGRPNAVVFQDWSNDRLGLGTAAVNLPESQPGSLTWLANHAIGVFR
jgi:hypothetical protein